MPETTTIGQLAAALAPARREVISLVGGGGKTTALFALGRQLPGRVILSTTTKMGTDRRDGHDVLLSPSRAELSSALAKDRVALVWKKLDGHRAVGFTPAECAPWFDLADHVVLEADGSRRRPFKAPAEHEPVVPAATTMLIACVGAPAFGAPIDQCCHRPELVAGIAGCGPSDPLTPSRLATVLLSDVGSKKDCPPAARFVVLLNRVSEADGEFVDELAEAIGGVAPIVAISPFVPDDDPESAGPAS